jgi:hypothetical protein
MINKKIKTIIPLILIATIILQILALSPVYAAVYNKKTYAYIGATPNPVGIEQEVLIHVGISDALNNVADGFEDLTVTVTKPDNTTETLGPFRTDSTGGTGTVMVPSMTGTYYLQTHFPAQWYNWTAPSPGGSQIWYEASSSNRLELVVQAEPVPYYQDLPLPTEYWTRPINAQLRSWYTLSGSSWMSTEYNEGIESPHILWSKPIGQAGGLIGGEHFEFAFDCGDAYVGKFSNRHTIAGLLIYNKFESRIPTEQQEMVAVDIKTGKELWSKTLIGMTGTTSGDTVPTASIVPEGITTRFPNGTPRLVSMSQTYMWDSFNLHGGYAFIWTTSTTGGMTTWMAFDPFTGGWRYTITNVPSGTTVRGPNGELLVYQINLAQGWVALWNSTKMVTWQTGAAMAAGSWNPHGNVYNATGVASSGALTSRTSAAWEWNVTLPQGLPGTGTIYHDDMIHGFYRGGSTIVYNTLALGDPPFYAWAVSLKPQSRGQLLYNRTYNDLVGGNLSLSISRSIEDRVFVMWSKESRQMWGYDIDTGNKLWGPSEQQHYLDIFGASRQFRYGNVYSLGYGGRVFAHNAITGQHIWTYDAFDPLNEILWGINWPTYIAAIFDGKIYINHYEHSPVDPKPRGAPFICLDAMTGEVMWRVDGLLRGSNWGGNPIVGDSVMMMLNSYDQQIYAIGKGPSATDVSAPDFGIQFGTHVMIKGTVTDISPGTNHDNLLMRFPNGVPAVSDESMGDWMLHVYQQFPRPANTVGVEVTIDVIDSNSNYRNIGTATTDSNGNFNFAWKPDISGMYTVIATFAGSKSYYPSNSQTAFVVEEEIPTATPTSSSQPQLLADTYFVPAVVGIAVLIIACFAVTLLVLRKRP